MKAENLHRCWMTIHFGKNPNIGGTPPRDKINSIKDSELEYEQRDILFNEDANKYEEK